MGKNFADDFELKWFIRKNLFRHKPVFGSCFSKEIEYNRYRTRCLVTYKVYMEDVTMSRKMAVVLPKAKCQPVRSLYVKENQ